MKVIVNLNNNKITSISPYGEVTEDVQNWLNDNNSVIADIDNPIESKETVVSDTLDEFTEEKIIFRELTEDEIIFVQKVAKKTSGENYTLNGTDYQVPFMKDDADGVTSVTLSFMKGAFTHTVIHFSNGTKIPITDVEFDEFATWFVNKRNSFFVGE